MKDGRWHQTHFVFHSLDPTLLPVVDIYNLPETNPGSHYHLEIGPVCFLWEFSLSPVRRGGVSPQVMPSAIHGDQSGALQWVLHPERSSFALPTSRWTADTEGGGMQGRWDADELWRRQGVLALIASQTAKASQCFSRRISTCMPAWRRKGAPRQTIFLEHY